MSASVNEFGMGNTAPVTWTIIDQLLWRPVAHGQGLEDSAADLREYMAAYITAVMSFDASSISDRMMTEDAPCREPRLQGSGGNRILDADLIQPELVDHCEFAGVIVLVQLIDDKTGPTMRRRKMVACDTSRDRMNVVW